MAKLTIDGQELEVAPGTTVLQACHQLGIEIPHFCYHGRLSVPANCRMCLVEQEKAPKPVPSCMATCTDGMVIHTDTEVVKRARQGVMELLLINHPLDCPICDQGGECDLQDQAVAYGFDRSRYREDKRAVTDKELGPLVKTVMTRCIHCTRCVRFLDEIAGTPELGLTGRGENVEITTYVEKALTSELSGNIVDICPVGALTNKPYAFIARSWELKKTDSVDVMDAVGSNIWVESRDGVVRRILPRVNEAVNEEWLADKSRHALDGLTRQRLDRPYVRDGKGGPLRLASWAEALERVASRLKGAVPHRVAALCGDLADVESQFLLKTLMDVLGSPHRDCRQDGANFDVRSRAGWLFNTTIAGLEQADAVLLIGTNPRREAPLINARLRKVWRRTGLPVAVVGGRCDLTYPYEHLGTGPEALKDLGVFGARVKKAQRPVLIVGAGVLARPDGAALQDRLSGLAEDYGFVREGWNGFNLLHTAAARVGGLEVGFVPGEGGLTTHGILDAAQRGEMDVIYNLGADELSPESFGSAFVIYQGHHGDRGAHRADVILPGCAYTEKDALYVNTEGRVQEALRAVAPPGEARADGDILQAVAEAVGHAFSFRTQAEVRAALATVNPVFASPGRVLPAAWQPCGIPGAVGSADFHTPVETYYMTDPVSRASATMARCVEEILPLTRQRCGCGGSKGHGHG